MRRSFAVLALSLLLSGCSHSLYIVGRTNHMTGTAKVETHPGMRGGEIVIALGSKNYRGRWIYMQTGGSIAFGSATAFSGGHSATATGTMVGLPTGGNGSIIASADDGSSLHCIFDYSEWSSTGVGACQDNKGEMYDVQIN